jgi:hypothetical protein
LVGVAELEFNALVGETKRAVDGLRCQRESVAQALETAWEANDRPGQSPDDATAVQIARLLDRLQRLNIALEAVMVEVEGLETRSAPPGLEPLPVLCLPLAQVADDNHAFVEADP